MIIVIIVNFFSHNYHGNDTTLWISEHRPQIIEQKHAIKCVSGVFLMLWLTQMSKFNSSTHVKSTQLLEEESITLTDTGLISVMHLKILSRIFRLWAGTCKWITGLSPRYFVCADISWDMQVCKHFVPSAARLWGGDGRKFWSLTFPHVMAEKVQAWLINNNHMAYWDD